MYKLLLMLTALILNLTTAMNSNTRTTLQPQNDDLNQLLLHRTSNILKEFEFPTTSNPAKAENNFNHLNNFLIYPTPTMFKEYILPFINSSEKLIQIFFHFLQPNLKFEKFLPPLRELSVQPILTLGNPKEMYYFQNKYAHLRPILISSTIPKVTNLKMVDPKKQYVQFSNEHIFELNSKILPCGKELLVQNNHMEFFCALRKYNNDEFLTIAKGEYFFEKKPFTEGELSCIWKAYNLNPRGLKICSLKIFYFLQLACLFYTKYIVSLTRKFHIIFDSLTRMDSDPHENFWICWPFRFISGIFLFGIYILFLNLSWLPATSFGILMSLYTNSKLWHILVYSPLLFYMYLHILPQVRDLDIALFPIPSESNKIHKKFLRLEKSFQLRPKIGHNLWAVPGFWAIQKIRDSPVFSLSLSVVIFLYAAAMLYSPLILYMLA